MKLKLEDPRVFSNLIGIISELVTEVRIKVNKEGIQLTAVDPATVAMVYFHIPSELFKEFEVEKEEILGVNLDNLKSILRRAGLGSSLSLEKEENLLKISIQDKIKRYFTLALIDIEGEEKEMPEWEFKSVIKMDAQSYENKNRKFLSKPKRARSNQFIILGLGLEKTPTPRRTRGRIKKEIQKI